MNLKKVLRWWQQGNDGQTLNTLLSLRDDSITKDFLQMTCTDQSSADFKITLDSAKALLDLSMPLIKSTHQEYNMVGLSSSCFIFNQLFDRILGLKNRNALMTRNQVDLKREENVQKADVLLEKMRDIVALPHFVRFKNGEANRRSQDVEASKMTPLQLKRFQQRTAELKSLAERFDGDLDYLTERIGKL